VQVNPVSGGVTDRWISFLSRANYGYKEKVLPHRRGAV